MTFKFGSHIFLLTKLNIRAEKRQLFTVYILYIYKSIKMRGTRYGYV